MTPQYYSKKKKTERLSFTITPALKNDLNDFVEKMRSQDPNNVEFKSISSFCYYSIKNILDIRKKGIELTSINELPDKNTQNFYEHISFQAVIPIFELGMALNKYSDENIKSQNLLFNFRKWVLNDLKVEDRKNIKILISRLKNYLVSNNLTRELKLDVSKSSRENYKAIIEYIGNYKNLHYNNLKGMAGILGILGFKIEDFTLSDNDLYGRFDFIETELFKRSDSAKKERKKLLEDNLKFLINYHRIINDKEHYLWIKLAENKDIAIKFITPITYKKYLDKIIDDINIFGDKEDFLLDLLKIFESFHWISIEDSDALSFRLKTFKYPTSSKIESAENDLKNYINKNYSEDKELKRLLNEILDEKPSIEEEYIVEIIEQFAIIRREDDIYYLEKK
ncbi:MAG: hypothetical protein ACFFBP_17835 [Promethearchaeota archaeon]